MQSGHYVIGLLCHPPSNCPLHIFCLMTHEPSPNSTEMAFSPLLPPSGSPPSYQPSLEDFSPPTFLPVSNLTRFQWDEILVGSESRAGVTSALLGWLCLPGEEGEDICLRVSGLPRHSPEAPSPTSAPGNSPKVSGGAWGVGQINGKCQIGF